MKKIIEIDMFKEYVGKLIFRCIVFAAAVLAYIFKSDERWWLYVIWAIMMGSMILQMFPQNKRITMGSKKGFASHYVQAADYSEIEMWSLCAEKQSCGNQGSADMVKFQRNFRHSLCV